MCLLKYIKGPVSDNLLAVNVLTDHKKPLQSAERQFYSFFFHNWKTNLVIKSHF